MVSLGNEWRLVLATSPRREHNAVRRMDTWLSEEAVLGISPFHWRPERAARHPEAWLLGACPLGGAIFTRPGLLGAAWHLDRVWIAPELRRSGQLAAVWPVWEERYGSISTDPTPALQGFLRARGWRPAYPGAVTGLPPGLVLDLWVDPSVSGGTGAHPGAHSPRYRAEQG
jgi:hypothetical protein